MAWKKAQVEPLEGLLHPLFLGLNALDLWDSLNLVLISYALMVFAPRWIHTGNLTLIVPCLQSILYISSLVLAVQADEGGVPDFLTFEGTVKAFQNPNVVFAGFLHYAIADCLVARMIVLDSVTRGASWVIHFLVVVPCIFLTMMVGPTGFLSYIFLRQIFLPIDDTMLAYYRKNKIL